MAFVAYVKAFRTQEIVIKIDGIERNNDIVVRSVTIQFHAIPNNLQESSFQMDKMQHYKTLFTSYFAGEKPQMSFVKLDLSRITQFQNRVLAAARDIPYGETVSYSSLASSAGYPKAVRAVASVMRNNPFPIVIPCHRVVRKDGTLGGYMGRQHGTAIELKKSLLALENASL